MNRDQIAEVVCRWQNDPETLEWPSEFVAAILAAAGKPHSGDCTKKPWPCLRCQADDAYRLTDAIMALDGWQTIDSAPKDGKVVDLWLRSYFWAADGNKQLAVELRAASCQWYSDQWCNEDGNPHETLQVFPEAEITHWRPLPQPPGTRDDTNEG